MPSEFPESKEILDVFSVSMSPATAKGLPGSGWNEIAVDFDTRFKGALPSSMSAETDLVKLEIVIANAEPLLDGIDEYFAWPGNNSLSESVKNTLQNEKINPAGRVIATYYLKVL